MLVLPPRQKQHDFVDGWMDVNSKEKEEYVMTYRFLTHKTTCMVVP